MLLLLLLQLVYYGKTSIVPCRSIFHRKQRGPSFIFWEFSTCIYDFIICLGCSAVPWSNFHSRLRTTNKMNSQIVDEFQKRSPHRCLNNDNETKYSSRSLNFSFSAEVQVLQFSINYNMLYSLHIMHHNAMLIYRFHSQILRRRCAFSYGEKRKKKEFPLKTKHPNVFTCIIPYNLRTMNRMRFCCVSRCYQYYWWSLQLFLQSVWFLCVWQVQSTSSEISVTLLLCSLLPSFLLLQHNDVAMDKSRLVFQSKYWYLTIYFIVRQVRTSI